MKGKRAMTGWLTALVTAVALVVVPALNAAPNDPDPKTSGEHIAYTFCHRTGSESNPFVAVTADDAAWAEAHMPGTDPAHPVLNGNDDSLIGIDLADPPRGPIAGEDCDVKNPPPPK
jgi:hypothetical protein